MKRRDGYKAGDLQLVSLLALSQPFFLQVKVHNFSLVMAESVGVWLFKKKRHLEPRCFVDTSHRSGALGG